MTLATFRLELRRNRSLVLWLGLITFIYSGTMAIFYPIMKENSAAIEDYMKLFPEEFMAAFGMTGSLGDPGVFFTTYIGSWLWPILAAIAGVLVATRPVAADLDRGFLELPLATPMPRVRYLGISIVGQAIAMLLIALATVAGVVVVGAIIDAGFDGARFFLVTPLAFAFGCAIAGVATLLSVVTLSRGIAAGVTVGGLLIMYLANVVAQIETDLGWLASFSLFHYFDTTSIIDEGVMPWGDVAVFTVIAVACWAAALVVFRNRDLAA